MSFARIRSSFTAFLLPLLIGLSISPSQAAELLPIPDKTVVLCFDDGNKSDRTFVADVLKGHGFGATFYISEGLGFLENKEHFVTWEEVKELHEMGFEIGNHTQHHRNVTTLTPDTFRSSLDHIQNRCKEHNLPLPTTFCYPGFSHSQSALNTVENAGFKFARRGVGPEFPDGGNGARGPHYDPKTDHPLLIPTTGYDGPHWQFEDLAWAVENAKDGKIAVLCFHGVPALRHPWVSTAPEDFIRYMQYLKDENCTVIALRDLAKYVDPNVRPNDPYKTISDRVWEPINLQTSPVENALGLDLGQVQFQWEFRSTNLTQSACQVLVASTPKKLDADVGDLWDSGQLNHTNRQATYDGVPLKQGQQIFWKVRTWNQGGEPEVYSQPSEFTRVASPSTKPSKRAASAPKNRIAFLGNRLISDMARYGYLETALTVNWPKHDITFRNLGWPADDVFGTARSEFGSGHNTRSWKPPGAEQGFGYRTLMQHVEEAAPSTILVAYGPETAFLKTQAGFEDFKTGYANLLNDLESVANTLILISPPRQENPGHPMPDPTENNLRLKRTAEFIRDIAQERGHQFIDLFHTLVPENSKKSLTDNGIHLTEKGHLQLAREIMKQLELPEPGFHVTFSSDGNLIASAGAAIENMTHTAQGVRFDLTPDKLAAPTLPHLGTIQIKDSEGIQNLKINGENAIQWNNSKLPQGANIPHPTSNNPAERLRQLIIEKNQLFTYRIRPLNKTYIFLFRRHEMGHLAYEMNDFTRLAGEKEELIGHLRRPQTVRMTLESIAPWRSPRDYPDHEVPRNIPSPDIDTELAAFTLPEGFAINLFASNPMIVNPINLNWDTRGRLWVSTSSTYPHIKPGVQPNDRIIILEDTDHDGEADRSTVFAEGLLVPHSVMPVPGGAYVCSSTEFIHLIDRDGDDRADERRVVYSGFGNADVHHMIHGLRWAPWGELYFTQSIYINSFIETSYGPRRLNGSGIWRFRPETERLEIYSRGMVNPWGYAFDYWGQSFGTDGAGGAGPHYTFPGSAYNSAVGMERVLSGLIPGKPKNTAAEIVSGGHLPSHWQGSLLANDFRANRTVRYELTDDGSGYSAKEVETVIHSKHRSFRPVDIKLGPEGAIYVADWYNPIIDHGEVDFHHPLRDKAHGRIWRLTVPDRPLVKRPVIHGSTINQLLDHLKAPEQWTRVQARRELASEGTSILPHLEIWLNNLDPTGERFEHHQLEALWLRGAIQSPEPRLLDLVFRSTSPEARAAATRMMFHWNESLPECMKLLAEAVVDEHPRVRLEAINALREIGTLEAVNVALRALDLPGDKNIDYSLRLTARDLQSIWLPALQAGKQVFDGKINRVAYALGAATDKRALAPLVNLIRNGNAGNQPDALRVVAALGGEEEMNLVFGLTARNPTSESLAALTEAARSNPAIPSNVTPLKELLTHTEETIRILAAELAGRWRTFPHREIVREQATNRRNSNEERLTAARALGQLDGLEDLQKIALSGSPIQVRATAIAAWAERSLSDAAPHAAKLLAEANSAQDSSPIYQVYSSRKEGPGNLITALGDAELSDQVAINGIRIAQASGRDLTDLVDLLTKAGSLKTLDTELSASDRAGLIQDAKTKGNYARGETIFKRPELSCVTCHAIKGKGGKVGPELGTLGTYMTPESILESLINPSSSIKQGYETRVITLKDDELVTGTLQRKTETAVLLRDATGQVHAIPNKEISSIDSSAVSLMPPGITSALRKDELIDLLHYLIELK